MRNVKAAASLTVMLVNQMAMPASGSAEMAQEKATNPPNEEG